MRVVIVSGIYPPDIGGPATHATDLRAELMQRGHTVHIVSLTDGPTERSEGVIRFTRAHPWPLRALRVTTWLVRNRKRYDAIYATGMGEAAVPAARLARRPVMLKIVGDPAWERAKRLGLTTAEATEFEGRANRSLRVRAMKAVRNMTVRRADTVFTPSVALGDWVRGWSRRDDVKVIRNGVRTRGDVPGYVTPPGGTLHALTVSRLIEHKRIDLQLQALAQTPGVTLDVVGDGPTRAQLEELARELAITDRVRFTGALDHADVIERMATADVFLLTSSYEGLPHVVIEALAYGTPVVTTAAEGTREAINDGKDSIIVEPDTVATALQRLRDDHDLLAQLRRGAATTGAQWNFRATVDAIEAELTRLTGQAPRRPAAVFFGKTRIPEPPPVEQVNRFAALSRELEITSINIGPVGRRRISGARVHSFPVLRPAALGGLLFYSTGPIAALAKATRQRAAIVCQSPYEAFGVLTLRRLIPRRHRPPVQVELHGDWATAARMYGSPLRRYVSPISDRMCEWGVRNADRVRAVSEVLEGRARQAGYRGDIDRFITFSEFDVFLARPAEPLPHEPHAIFVGVLERYKAVDVLLDAWTIVHQQLPAARLTMVGAGTMQVEVEQRIAGLGGSVRLLAPTDRQGLSERIDQAQLLVLPSRSEGLARIVFEAMARGRPVVASAVGGIHEVLEPGENGLLVPAEDVHALAHALTTLLSEPHTLARMAQNARRSAEERRPAEEYEAGVERLAAWIRQQRG